MPLPKLYPESVLGRFARGTLDSIEAALADGQTRADFIRAAVDEKIARASACGEAPVDVAEATPNSSFEPGERSGAAEQSGAAQAGSATTDFCAGLDQVTRSVLGRGAAPNDLGAMLIRMGLELMLPATETFDHERLMARALRAARSEVSKGEE